MATTIPSLTPYPDLAPQRGDRTTFRDRADSKVAHDVVIVGDGVTSGEFNTSVTAINTVNLEVAASATFAEAQVILCQNQVILAEAKVVLAEAQVVLAEDAATAAAASSNATKWLIGTTYEEGNNVWGSDHISYRSVQAGNIGHDPVGDDETWWVKLGGKQDGDAYDMEGSLLTRPLFKNTSNSHTDLGTLTGGTINIDRSLGDIFYAIISTAETTFTATNIPATGTTARIELVLTNAGSQVLNFMANSVWQTKDNVAPTFLATGTSTILAETKDAGANWLLYFCGSNL